ncbi:MAG: HIT family protein [Pelagibacteraceae bacterium]|jgi:diadenosine tetraphosphate (Ap4A) HIT family hydrolase
MSNRVNKNFIKTSHLVTKLKLCSVRLIDNQKFPWIILVPNRINVTDITELKTKDQNLLMKEIVFCSKIMKKVFKTKKLNVEKIGNIVPQLHIHIIARNKNDSSWPLSVWVVKGKNYSTKVLEETLIKLKKSFI